MTRSRTSARWTSGLALVALVGLMWASPTAGAQQIVGPLPPAACDVVDCPPAVDCHPKATTPQIQNGTVVGWGQMDCTGNAQQLGMVVTLQRHSWGPVWNNIHEDLRAGADTNHLPKTAVTRCLPGSNDYRVVVDIEWTNYNGKTDKKQDVSGHLTNARPSACNT